MSESPEKSTRKPLVDRRQNRGGIEEGGRRKSDNSPVPKSNASRIWFGLSLVLTLLIMIWTFSFPFRSDKPLLSWEKPTSNRPELVAPDIKKDPQHKMTFDEYRSYAWEIERELQDLYAEKSAVPRNLPNREHAAAAIDAREKAMRDELKLLAKLESKFEDGSKFDPKSIEAEQMRDLRKKLESEDE